MPIRAIFLIYNASNNFKNLLVISCVVNVFLLPSEKHTTYSNPIILVFFFATQRHTKWLNSNTIDWWAKRPGYNSWKSQETNSDCTLAWFLVGPGYLDLCIRHRIYPVFSILFSFYLNWRSTPTYKFWLLVIRFNFNVILFLLLFITIFFISLVISFFLSFAVKYILGSYLL